eukprot:CAMPEP_0197434148 /NCGR_PEP_ID=MMETSP1175-20131217/1920_1 /TAXON_ID=1003142 /ORGANISM="Triceratium dubium, Strain CCMP147" /LENGTH=260 /DNA_ID=CAMNT_0042962761 /DNA_START=80 /DNA_END=862 /DNA_ORIENTATION=-
MKIPIVSTFAISLVAVVNTEAFGVVSSRPGAATTSPLFWKASSHKLRIVNSRQNRLPLQQHKPSHEFLRSSNSNEPEDAEIVKSGKGMTIMERIDSAGSKLKPMAIEAKEQSIAASDDRSKRILFTVKACVLFTLFALYRAYRGFFILLPAVFREVYAKMETAVQAPFVDEEELDQNNRDVDPSTGTVRFRTRFTVSVLSAIVAASYVVTGLWKVLMKFVKTITNTSSVKDSFEAAADEVLANEEKIKKMTKKRKINGED